MIQVLQFGCDASDFDNTFGRDDDMQKVNKYVEYDMFGQHE